MSTYLSMPPSPPAIAFSPSTSREPVRLENEAGIRYACIGAAKVVPAPGFRLQCCRISAIPSIMFSEDIANAIYTNPTHQQERLREDGRISSVGMDLSMGAESADDGARICVSLHLGEGTKLNDMLFPST